MFKTIISRYAGTCKRCRHDFEAGTRIRYGGRGRTYHLAADCPAAEPRSARPVHGSQEWAETRGDDLGPSIDSEADAREWASDF